MRITVGLAQMRCDKGDWEANVAHAEGFIAEAAHAECDIVVLPEMALSGYCPEAALPLDNRWVRALAAMSRHYAIAISAGFVEANGKAKPFVTQVLLQDGAVTGVYRKVNIDGEEEPCFSPGIERPVFWLRASGGEVACALAICADSDLPDLFRDFARQGAKVVFHSSAPGLYGRRTTEQEWQAGYDWYEGYLAARLPAYARENHITIAVATQCGATVDEDFPGGSFVFGPDGELIAGTTGYNETLLISTLNLEDAAHA